jgi:hypothetical protein
MPNPPAIDRRIEEARARLATHLGELQDRVTRAREMISPGTYLRSPWLKLGIGVALGYAVGRRRRPRLLTHGGDPPRAPAPSSGIVGAAIRTAVTALVGAAIERAVARVMKGPADEPAPPEPDDGE